VVGHFTAAGSAFESEVWGDVAVVGPALERTDAAPLKRIMDGLDPRRVFPSGDHRALAAVMASVLDAGTSPAERSRGRELVERVYNWDRDGENLVRLLETTGRK
jgi:glycosyltransferase involved in cell wall biosynthesis